MSVEDSSSSSPTTLQPDEAEVVRLARAVQALESHRYRSPASFYTPHTNGQEQFHRSRHAIRALFPGNRFGKTRAAGTEVAYYLEHDHPYTPDLVPHWPIQAIWFAQEFRQWELLKPQIEGECLPAGWNWNDQKHRYEWPKGDTLYVISCDRDWTYIQGINPDLVVFDEEPPLKLWREMMMRRLGERTTRYILTATATGGETWMEAEVWRPWAEHHKAAGVSLDQAKAVQSHPYIWVWDTGGVADNPIMTTEQIAWANQTSWASEEERRVRLRGGFGRFNGRPVFSLDALAKMETMMAEWDRVRGPGRVRGLAMKEAA